MDGFSLRPATPEDLPRILELEAALHASPWTAEHFEQEWEKPYSHTWVFSDDETDEKIAGYVVFWSLQDPWEVLNVVVALPYRGLGFGKALLRKVSEAAIREGVQTLVLDVRKGNLPAIALYQALGFTVRQIRKGYYSNGEDGYFMALPLKEDGIRF
jgi:ribosomal-protein-alanine N-acetyltransferase